MKLLKKYFKLFSCWLNKGSKKRKYFKILTIFSALCFCGIWIHSLIQPYPYEDLIKRKINHSLEKKSIHTNEDGYTELTYNDDQRIAKPLYEKGQKNIKKTPTKENTLFHPDFYFDCLDNINNYQGKTTAGNYKNAEREQLCCRTIQRVLVSESRLEMAE